MSVVFWKATSFGTKSVYFESTTAANCRATRRQHEEFVTKTAEVVLDPSGQACEFENYKKCLQNNLACRALIRNQHHQRMSSPDTRVLAGPKFKFRILKFSAKSCVRVGMFGVAEKIRFMKYPTAPVFGWGDEHERDLLWRTFQKGSIQRKNCEI